MTKTCPDCNQRRILGRCRFGGPNVVIKPHCRSCCAAPERDKWRAIKAAPRARKAPAAVAPRR